MADGTRPIMIHGRPVHDRLRRQLPDLVTTVIAAILEQVGHYRRLPAEAIADDIVAAVRENLLLFTTVVRDGRVPEAGELRWFAESATRRAEEGIPLGVVLRAYEVGTVAAWRAVTREVTDGEVEDLRAATEFTFGYLGRVLEVVADAYVAEARSAQGQEQSSRQTLLSALLAGEPPEHAADRAGIRLPGGYLVLAMRVGPHPDETDDATGAVVAARRKVRRMRSVLARACDESALSIVDTEGGTVLVPSEGTDARAGLERLVGGLADAAGADIHAAAGFAEPAGVAAQVRQVRDVLDVVRSTGRPPGLYLLTDVLLDYHLSRTTPATPALAALLDPLDRNEDLLPTLEVHLRNELNRKLTGRTLHVHPNTVDYRMRRIATLTGLDPALPSHVRLLAAALAARRTPGTRPPRDRG